MSAAIVGLGMTEMDGVGRSSADLAVEAVRAAVADSGLAMSDVDGLLVATGLRNDLTPHLSIDLGLQDLRLLSVATTYGASAGALVAHASRAIADGSASVVVCVFADAPRVAGQAMRWGAGEQRRAGYQGWTQAVGAYSPNVLYALAAQRHMDAYGTTSEQLGQIAVAQRAWAMGNPQAYRRTPLSLAEHQSSPMISTPLRRADCCLVSNGAVALVLVSSERAPDLPRPPVHVRGFAEAHRPRQLRSGSRWGLETGAVLSGPEALRRAGLSLTEIDVVELYDCYTYTVLVSLEDYGFCAKGEGGDFVSDGRLAPGGSLAVNTGGGQLSAYYMWGFTPLSEAVIQLRGDGGGRQAPRAETALVSGNGGILEYHSTLILGTEAGR